MKKYESIDGEEYYEDEDGHIHSAQMVRLWRKQEYENHAASAIGSIFDTYKTALREKDDEIARLRARIAELEQWTPTPRVTFDPTRVTSISSGAVVCENMTRMEKKKK